MIETDAGRDVYRDGNPSKDSKLELLEKWLVGTASPYEPRLAPSIIARSEAELLGISSPRFAIRVYLGDKSFVNIRRRKITERQIIETYEPNIADALQGASENWIADCLLRPPAWLETDYHILTCNLGPDYGEYEIGKATPFVTHISIGGGLCAQAVCFMVLCLMEANQVFGISEITRLSAPVHEKTHEEETIELHGLKQETIRDFFRDHTNLLAQLQHIEFAPETADEHEAVVWPIRFAIKSYIMNNIPVLPMLSASRMMGLRSLEKRPTISRPILRSSCKVITQDRRDIPLTRELNYDDVYISTAQDLERDNHCVVIVGTNKDGTSLLINDPATFPFIQCTVEQLIEARSYKNFQIYDEKAADGRWVLCPVCENDLGNFTFISVAPKGITVWLLAVLGIPNIQPTGLIDVVVRSLSISLGRRPKFLPKAKDHLSLHLGEWSSSGFQFRSNISLEPQLESLIKSIMDQNEWREPTYFWVSDLQYPDKTGRYTRLTTIWHANHSLIGNLDIELVVASFAQTIDGNWECVFD